MRLIHFARSAAGLFWRRQSGVIVMRQVPNLALFLTLLTLCIVAALPTRAADYAPLNCAAARSPTERTICGIYALGQLEARMATLYEWTTSLVAMGQRGDIQDAQRDFIRRREACGDKAACIRSAYDARIVQLQAVMKEIAGQGPF
jgi:uncharacterized protein